MNPNYSMLVSHSNEKKANLSLMYDSYRQTMLAEVKAVKNKREVLEYFTSEQALAATTIIYSVFSNVGVSHAAGWLRTTTKALPT